MKREYWFILSAAGAIASSYWGAHRATVNALRVPEAQIRLVAVRVEQRQADSLARIQHHAQMIAEIRTRVLEQRRLDNACYFDFKHAASNEEIRMVLHGRGPVMANEPGHCELVGMDSVRWVP